MAACARAFACAAAARRALRLHPPPDPPAPALTRHVVVEREGESVASYLARELEDCGVDESYARELVDFGAVWFAERTPPRTLRGVPGPERTRRLRGGEEVALRLGNYLRVHVSPKRFPEALSTSWRDCVLKRGDGFVVMHKPAGVSVTPTVDNVRESCLAMLESALGLSEGTLKPVHRLDVGTEGVLVLATTSEFAKEFGDMLAKRSLTKVYRVLTSRPVTLGYHLHMAEPAKVGPRKMLITKVETDDVEAEIAKVSVRGGAEPGGVSEPKICILRVLECSAIGSGFFEARVELLTGRTHQIRAQFAALGAPLVGETLYRAPDDLGEVRVQQPSERLGLQAELQLHADCALGASGSTLRALEPWWVRERVTVSSS